MPLPTRREWVGANDALSVRKQCSLLGLNRSVVYYETSDESALNLTVMRKIDELYTQYPFYGSRKICACLRREGYDVNRKRIQRLMREMGIEAIYAKPKTSVPNEMHEKYPYLLRGLVIDRADQVWATDITYIRTCYGFVYLVAILDWYSRYVLSWEISTTLDTDFCITALERAFEIGTPDIFNSDQGCQFTSNDFTKVLKERGVRISMDGVGRCMDNIFVERLWRSVKYEEVYIKDYSEVREAISQIGCYMRFYNDVRLHQALAYQTPAEVYFRRETPVRNIS